jgi:hypothetical protein
MNGAIPCPPYPSGCLAWRPFIQPDDPMAMRARGIGTYFPDPVCSLHGHSRYACRT